MSSLSSSKTALQIPSPYWIVSCLYQARVNILLATLGGLIIACIAMLFMTQKYEVTATLLSTSVKSEELDRIAEKLGEEDYVKQAFWNPSTTE